MKINKDTDALLVVDVQNSFITGSLAVPSAGEIIPMINKIIPKFGTVIYSRDAHKKDHPSFQAQGGPWPEHCVIGSSGYKLHKDLTISNNRPIFVNKGKYQESYSAFSGTIVHGDWNTESIENYFKFYNNAKRLFICGLATDYCVKATVLDALKLFDGDVFVLLDAVRAVNDDNNEAIKEMAVAGAIIILSAYLEN